MRMHHLVYLNIYKILYLLLEKLSQKKHGSKTIVFHKTFFLHENCIEKLNITFSFDLSEMVREYCIIYMRIF